MKTQLLRKLRKHIYLEQRNSSFRVIDNNMPYPDSESEWTDNKTAYALRRISILEYARKYFYAKRIIK